MTRTRQDTRTIQLWPGGQSVTYRGDIDGPAAQRSLRDGDKRNETHTHTRACYATDAAGRLKYSPCRMDGLDRNKTYLPDVDFHGGPEVRGLTLICDIPTATNPWRKGTPAEWAAIRREERARMYLERDVLGCESSLISDLMKLEYSVPNLNRNHTLYDLASGFGQDEMRNLYADPSDWDVDRCREYASDNGVELPPSDNDMDADEYLEALRDACREHAQDHPAEVYEWWRVSGWLCRQLHAIGEVTIDNGYGHWWGRQCSGQAIKMDGTLQKVAELYERGT